MFQVCNSVGIPIIRPGFPNFPEAELLARTCGQRCHIRRYQPNGDFEYWSPLGKRDTPLWYGGKRTGRPPTVATSGMKARTIYISEADWVTAQQLGAGVASEGIRQALGMASALRRIPNAV